MPRAFLVKRKSQCGVVFPADVFQAQVPNKILKEGSAIKPSPIHRPFSITELSSSQVFDLHEVEVFNKCHSQFHQCHLSPSDHLSGVRHLESGVRHLEYNQSICEQVNILKKDDFPKDVSKEIERCGNDSLSIDEPFDRLEQTRDLEPGSSSDGDLVKYVPQDIKQTTSSNHILKTHQPRTPAYVSEILAKQRQKILAKHVVNIQTGFFDLKKVSRRGRNNARQPIAGLEYIQNGTDMQYRTMTSLELSNVTESNSADNVKTTDGEHDESDGKQTQQRKYICDICNKGFSRSNTLVTHKRIHTGDKPFECEICGRAFRQPGNLTRHRLIHTTVKPYKCSQCGKAFNRASNLHTHMRTHTNYKPFVCQYCGKGFHQKIDMKIHSYTHTGEKPHKCKKCGRGFKQLTHLTYHMRTHSDVKMYTCAYCGKGFNQKGNLQAHIYGHTGERPYRCELCGKGFTLASTLNTHRRTHTNRLAIPTFAAKPVTFGAMHLVG